MAALLAILFAASLSLVAPSFAAAAPATTPHISHAPTGDLKTGEHFTLDLAIENTGDTVTTPGATPIDALGIAIELPENLDFIGFTTDDPAFWDNPDFPGGCATISLGATQLICFADPDETLNPGEVSPEVHVDMRVKPTATGTISLTAQTQGGGGTNLTAVDSFAVVPAPVLNLNKSHSGLFKRNSDATYDLAVTNEGPLPTTGTVTITDELPAGLAYNSASSTGNYWNCGNAGQTVTCTSNAVIDAGASAPTLHLTVDVDAAAPDEVTNEATTTSPGAAPGESSDVTPIYSENAELIRYSVNPAEVATQTGDTGSFFRLRNLFNDSNVFLDFTQLVDKPVFTGAYEPGDNSVSFDKSGIDFPTYTIPMLDAGLEALGQKIYVDVNVDFTPTDSWNGSYDPLTGEADLNMKTDIALSMTLATALPGLPVGTCATGETDVDSLTTASQTPPDPDVVPSPVTAGLPFGPDSNGTLINNNVSVSGVSCYDVNPLITALAGLDAEGLAVAVNGLLGTPAATGATDIQLETHAAFPEDNPALTMKVAPESKIILGTGGAYLYDIKNESDQPTDGSTIIVSNTLPNGLAYVSAAGSDPSWDCSAAGQDVTCENDGTYAPGASLPVLKVNVNTVGDASYPQVVNFASVGGGGSEGQFIASHATDIASPAFTLAMGSDTANHVVGSNTIMRPNITNSGTEPTAGDITLVGQLPRGMKFVSAGTSGYSCTAGAATAAGQTVTCVITSTIAGGAGFNPQITVAITPAAADTISTSWTVSGGGAPEAGNASIQSAERPVVTSQLSVTSTHTGDFAVGSQGQYTITLSNTGLGTTGTNPVTVTTNLPDGLRFVSAEPSSAPNSYWQCSASGQLVQCTNTTPGGLGRAINPGANATALVITVDVENDAYPSVINRVTASGGAAPNVANASDPTNVTADTALAIVKSHEGKFTAGEDGAFSLDVYNPSAVESDGSTVTIEDSLPAGLTYESASSEGDYWDCSNAEQVVTCTSDAVIDSEDSAPTLTINTEVGDAAVPGVTNTATVSGGGMTGEAESSDSVIVEPAPVPPPTTDKPILSIDKSHQGDFKSGQSGSYKIAVSNTGKVPTDGTITATDALPIGLTYESATGNGWSCSATGQKVDCTSSAVIAAGGNATVIDLKVKADDDAAPGVTNTASVQGGGAVAQAIAYDPTKVIPTKPEITTVKVTPKKKKVKAGKAVTLTARVTNGGDGAANGVSVCATGPAKVKLPACRQVNLAAGQTMSMKFKVKTTKKSKGKAKVKVTASSSTAGTKSASSKLTIKKAKKAKKSRKK